MLKNKVVLITGATSGIGKALAMKLGAQECKLVITGRNYEKLVETEKELKAMNIDTVSVISDVSSEIDCSIAVNRAYKEYGRLDILICNAGITMRALFENTDISVLKKIMDTNFWGTVYCCKYALPYLKASKGTIVGISSIAGYRGLPGRSGYSASKFAVNGFLESLRTELLHSGMHVLVACPGFTATNIRNTALNAHGEAQLESTLNESSMMSADTVAHHIVQAIVLKKRELILTSQGKTAVWLNKFMPSFMDKMVHRHFKKEKDPLLK